MMANYSIETEKTLGQILPSDMQLTAAQFSIPVKGLDVDSRSVEIGDVFFAYNGVSCDGRDFIQEAVENGASAVVFDDDNFVFEKNEAAVPVVGLPNLQKNIGDIAACYFSLPANEMRCIGITGTNGKTTCSLWLAQMLHSLGEKSAVIGTLGQGVHGEGEGLNATANTTPGAIELQKMLYDFQKIKIKNTLMEVSSHGLDQGRVNGIPFHSAVLTNLSQDHLDYHESMQAYSEAKAKLFLTPELLCAVINFDDEFGRQLLGKTLAKDVYSYSLSDTSASVYLKQYSLGVDGVEGCLYSPWGEGDFTAPIYGDFNVSNLLAVVTTLCANGHALSDVLSLLPQLVSPAGRFEKVTETATKAKQGRPNVFVDYAHTPDALEKMLLALRPMTQGRLWCVFGCGGDRDSGKRQAMGRIVAELADYTVVTSDNPRSENPQSIIQGVLKGVPKTTETVLRQFVDREMAIEFAMLNAAENDVVLIAGKGHETYQEIQGKKQPFDDVAVARAGLLTRGLAS